MATLVGTRIRERRETLGLKQAEVARSAGVSPSYLNLIEHNRRRIGGKVLLNIAAALDISPSTLSEGAETALVQSLQKAAAVSKTDVEISRVEEMVGRFPGWSRHLAALQADNARLERDLERLNDRLTHDPFLSESLHDILSNVTAIHSTAGILNDVSGIQEDQKNRFLANLYSESLRLSNTSKSLVTYFDRASEALELPSTPLDEFEAFLTANAYYFAEIEAREENAISLAVENSADLASPAARDLARLFLVQYSQDSEALPQDAFVSQAVEHNFAPDKLAKAFRCTLPMVFRRLAFLPPHETAEGQTTEFGLITCDISGAITLRKPLSGFPLPRYGAACPVWPLYQSLVQPGVPLKVVLNTPDGGSFQSYGLCERSESTGFNQPQKFEASMLISAINVEAANQAVPVGLNCRICPRHACTSRREPSIIEVPE